MRAESICRPFKIVVATILIPRMLQEHERPAGFEPAPLTWRASVQPKTPWARNIPLVEPETHRDRYKTGSRRGSASFARASPSREGSGTLQGPLESRAGIEPARAPGCNRWPYRLGDLDRKRTSSRRWGRFQGDNPATAVRSEETGRVEHPGPWSGGLANRCAKPTCTSSPEDRVSEGGGRRSRTPHRGAICFSGQPRAQPASPSGALCHPCGIRTRVPGLKDQASSAV